MIPANLQLVYLMSYFADLSIFRRNKNYTFLFIGQFVSFFGSMITSVALPYLVYTVTHSILMVGILSLVQLIPLLFTALLGGVFADRYHRRPLLLIAEFSMALGSLMLAVNASFATPHVLLIFMTAGCYALRVSWLIVSSCQNSGVIIQGVHDKIVRFSIIRWSNGYAP